MEWVADVENPASRRVAENAGYVVSGVRRLGMLQRGRRVDVWFGSLLPGELVDPAAPR